MPQKHSSTRANPSSARTIANGHSSRSLSFRCKHLTPFHGLITFGKFRPFICRVKTYERVAICPYRHGYYIQWPAVENETIVHCRGPLQRMSQRVEVEPHALESELSSGNISPLNPNSEVFSRSLERGNLHFQRIRRSRRQRHRRCETSATYFVTLFFKQISVV